MTDRRFRVIYGGGLARGKSNATRAWQCRICVHDTGHSTHALISVKIDAQEDARGRISGGRKVLVCAFCMSRGKFTPATA